MRRLSVLPTGHQAATDTRLDMFAPWNATSLSNAVFGQYVG